MTAYNNSVIKLKKYRCYSRKSCKGQSAVLLSEPRTDLSSVNLQNKGGEKNNTM